MRAFAVQRFGESPAIHDLPVPGTDEDVLLRVGYAGVNPRDSIAVGRLTAGSSYPYVLGADFAGVAERVPAGAAGLRVGDRVFGMAGTHGAYAEYTAVAPGARAEPLARIPDHVTDEQAAALPTAAVTALRAIQLLGVSAGQHIIVMGAAGGVGGYAVQLARSLGAHVIGTVRGDRSDALSLGAEEAYDSNTGDPVDAVHAAHPDGLDAVLDLVSGPDAIGRDAEILKPGGSLVSTRFVADEGWFAQRHIVAHNSASSSNPLISPEGLATVAQLLADGTITARIQAVVALDDAGQVLERLRTGGLSGKAVLRV